jgi:hypothetical protein
MMHSSLHRALQATAVIALVAASPISASAGAGPAQHHKRLLFVSNLDGSIRLYSADIHKSDAKLLGTITTGASRPEGVWIDRKGTLYVENGAQYPTQADIEEYKRGATSPFLTITDGLNSPDAVAVGGDGTVYVNQLGSGGGGVVGEVVEYAPGQTTPERSVRLNRKPEYGLNAGGMAFDPQGNLLAANSGNATEVHVFKIAPGSSKATDLGIQGYGGAAIAVDGDGNLYAGGGNGFIAVYPSGATSPSRTIPTSYTVYGMTAARNGTLYAVADSSVAEYAPGANTPTNYVDTLYGETFTYDAAVGIQ